MDLSDLVEMLSTDVFSLKVYEKLNAILASQRLQSEKETSRTTEWNFLRRESILIIVVCFLTWLGVNFRDGHLVGT